MINLEEAYLLMARYYKSQIEFFRPKIKWLKRGDRECGVTMMYSLIVRLYEGGNWFDFARRSSGS